MHAEAGTFQQEVCGSLPVHERATVGGRYSMSEGAEHWLGWHSPNPQARLRLFCFPYGGGGAAAFRTWQEQLPPTVEVCPVQLPGREDRLHEPCLTRVPALVGAMAEPLSGLFDKPFAFFGHSLGATIAFELARRLRKEGLTQPLELFVSGRRAPHIPDSGPRIYDLPADEFIAALQRRNYVRREVAENPRLLKFVMPLLKADYELLQTYSYEPGDPFDFPITAFGGEEDFAESGEALAAWREQTRASFALHILPGDHFFIQSAQPPLLEVINERLRSHL